MKEVECSNEVWIVVMDHKAYGPFATKIDACDAAIHRWGNDGPWDALLLNSTLSGTLPLPVPGAVVRKKPDLPKPKS